MSFNKIIIVGNLGRDPEVRYTPQGIAVCSFSVATNEKKKSPSGEDQNITTWFRVTLWRNQAEVAGKYLTKGSPVYIEGKLRMEEYTDKEGKARQSLEVLATDMQFIGSRGEEGSQGSSSNAPRESSGRDNDAPRRDNKSDSGSSRDNSRNNDDDFSGSTSDEDIPF
ncbi:MAG: single-stranded DNA-binding protein [Pyrinomonadaceae bacterium]|nr:single-stranded DNA-binding protein [Pyrinomonadaceae bacterium]